MTTLLVTLAHDDPRATDEVGDALRARCPTYAIAVVRAAPGLPADVTGHEPRVTVGPGGWRDDGEVDAAIEAAAEAVEVVRGMVDDLDTNRPNGQG